MVFILLPFLPQVAGADGDDEFEERFLHVFGLGDPDDSANSTKKPVTRTASEPSEEEREALLKKQEKNSPW